MGIEADRKPDPVFVEERFERYRHHRRVMLEHRVQGDDRDILSGESLFHPLQLPFATQPGHSIWNVPSTTIRPRKSASVSGGLLNHWLVTHSGAS